MVKQLRKLIQGKCFNSCILRFMSITSALALVIQTRKKTMTHNDLSAILFYEGNVICNLMRKNSSSKTSIYPMVRFKLFQAQVLK